MAYIKRHLENVLKNPKNIRGVVAVTGARQTGKSTMLDHLLGNITKIVFDDPRAKMQAKTDPMLFINESPTPLFIDEVQYATEIFPIMKMKVDESGKDGLYYISGSQKFNMMKGMTESLAGRVAIFELLGLSMREIADDDFPMPFLPIKEYVEKRKPKKSELGIWELIYRGQMPEMYAKERDWKRFYGDYLKTYLERDVSQLAQVGDELKFQKFMEVLAARNANVLQLDTVCKDVGISHPTGERWLSILRISNIVYLLRPYHSNLTKRAIKSPKLYFLDTGLAAYLTHWDTKEVLRSGAKAGDFFENFVIVEILKSYYNAGIEPRNLYFYRDKDKNEIDLVIEQNGVLYPVEIKSFSNPDKSDIKAFDVLSKIPNVKVGDGAVLCPCNSVLSIAEGVRAVPVEYV